MEMGGSLERDSGDGAYLERDSGVLRGELYCMYVQLLE